MPNESWSIRLLGTLSASRTGITIDRFRSQKTGVLLACLALSPENRLTRGELVELLWPDARLEAGQVSLRVALFSLRRLLEPQPTLPGTVIYSDRRCIGLEPEAFVTDVSEFRRAIDLAVETQDHTNAFEHYTRAVNLYHGELLPGYYEDWILTERNRLSGAYVGALERLVRYHAEKENWQEAIEMAWRGIQADPLLESAYCDLMRLYHALKRPGEARAVYELLELRLRETLGASPGRTARRLVESLTANASTSPDLSVPSSSPRKAREDESGSSPGAAPEAIPETPPYRISPGLSYFFGREEQIAQLIEMLLPASASPDPPASPAPESEAPTCSDPRGGARLVTLTGPGGTGKTRLALEIGARLQTRFAGGAAFISLAHLQDPRLLAAELRDALGAPRQDAEHPLDDVIATLRRRPTLLILDNLEQIVESAAHVVRDLMAQIPTQVCLLTSRRSLGVKGEREFPVSSLTLPEIGATAEERLRSASVQLFLDRARAVQPDFQITEHNSADIASLCQRLDGMPLAIELAAARVRGLVPAQMLALLTDRFHLLVDRRAGKDSRHRSLRTTIEWSLQFLPLEARRLFARLSVFRGGWSLEAAQAICLQNQDNVETLDLLEQLRTDSMIQTQLHGTEARFQMLESLREFGAGQLTPLERDEIAHRHADYFCSFVQSRFATGTYKTLSGIFEVMDQENDNLRAALHTLLSGDDRRRIQGVRLAISLAGWWHERAAFREGGEWMQRALAAAPASLSPQERARALCASGYIAVGRGDNSAAQQFYRAAIAILENLDEKLLLADALQGRAFALQMLFALEEAEQLLQQSLALDRELESRPQIALVLSDLAGNRWNAGDVEGARAYYLEALHLAAELEATPLRARIIQNLTLLECLSGNTTLARAYSDEGLSLAEEMRSPMILAFALLGRGLVECADLRFDLSRESLNRSLRILVERGERRILMLTLYALARLATAMGRYHRSVRLSASNRALRARFHPEMQVRQNLEQNLEAELEPARVHLSASEFETAQQQGNLQTYEEIIAYALSDFD
ncbi:MAG: DNA-binding transcriptional activator of the family [Chthonomonadales bacterium]|nr:DNA-binding transcriptional activator of the family [Chthonomonadales bacterium]